MADRGHPDPVDAAPGLDIGETPARRGRFAQELEAATDPVARELARQRARADRAEAALADLRRDSARAILGLRREVTYWRLVAGGAAPADATSRAGLTHALDDDPSGETA